MNPISEPVEETWSHRTKVVVSILVALHVFAVFAAPCASPPPASDTWQRISGRLGERDGILTPYLRAAYLNHGYRFFAPNPGPSHLVRYEIDVQSGATIQGEFPDPEEYYPRLLYHRMFMLSETAFNLADPVLTPPDTSLLSATEKLAYERQYAIQLAAADALANSIARRLLHDNDGIRVRLYLRTHALPEPRQRLDDERLYSERFWCEISEDFLKNGPADFPAVAMSKANPQAGAF